MRQRKLASSRSNETQSYRLQLEEKCADILTKYVIIHTRGSTRYSAGTADFPGKKEHK